MNVKIKMNRNTVHPGTPGTGTKPGCFRGFLKILTLAALILLLFTGCASPAFAQSKEPAEDTLTEEAEKKGYKNKKSKKEETEADDETEEAVIDRSGLTPDGNMDLVDDLSGTAAADLEFITVSTKDGHTFYLIIEHGKETDNVHFLNQVDEADLMALMSDEEKEAIAQEAAEREEEEKASKESMIPQPETRQPVPETQASASADPEPEVQPGPQRMGTLNSAQLLLVIGAIAAAIAAALFYFLKVRPKRNGQYDPDGMEFEDDPEYGADGNEEEGILEFPEERSQPEADTEPAVPEDTEFPDPEPEDPGQAFIIDDTIVDSLGEGGDE